MQSGNDGTWQRIATDSPRNSTVGELFRDNAKTFDRHLHKALKPAPASTRTRKSSK